MSEEPKRKFDLKKYKSISRAISNYEDLTLEGLNFPKERFELLFNKNKPEWEKEIADIEEFFKRGGREH